MGIPFIIMGKKKFGSTHGVKRNSSLMKKMLDQKVERDIYETTLLYIYIYNIYIYIYIYIFIYTYIHIYAFKLKAKKVRNVCRLNEN